MEDEPKRYLYNRTHIILCDPEELRYWCERFGVDPEQLRAVVAKVGLLAYRVAQEFENLRIKVYSP